QARLAREARRQRRDDRDVVPARRRSAVDRTRAGPARAGAPPGRPAPGRREPEGIEGEGGGGRRVAPLPCERRRVCRTTAGLCPPWGYGSALPWRRCSAVLAGSFTTAGRPAAVGVVISVVAPLVVVVGFVPGSSGVECRLQLA